MSTSKAISPGRWPKDCGSRLGRRCAFLREACTAGNSTFNTTTPKFGSSLEAGNALFVRGNTYLGPENATPTTNGLVRINNTGGYSSIAFDDAGTQRGVIELYNGGGFYSQLANAGHYHHFYTGGRS